MTTAIPSPSVCRGAGKQVAVYRSGKYGRPEGLCPVCKQQVQVYEKGGRRFIGTHERKVK